MSLRFTETIWQGLLSELERRSENRNESGAFLLGSEVDAVREVMLCIYYDDLFQDALHPTHIYLPSDAYQKLWTICERTGYRVVADIHSHPRGVTQSDTDRQHPMIPEVGHVALIVPNFARHPVNPYTIGCYEYLGDFKWRRIKGAALRARLSVD